MTDGALRILNTCIHMAAPCLPDRECKAGVRYADVQDRSQKPYRRPCNREGIFSGAATTCPHATFPTPEEAERLAVECEARMARRIEGLGIAREAIVKATGGKRGVAGKLACPVCSDGELSYSVSGYNGHIHAACSKAGCVRWME